MIPALQPNTVGVLARKRLGRWGQRPLPVQFHFANFTYFVVTNSSLA